MVNSKELFAEAQTLLPGGVSSPVRAIKPYPFYVKSAKGAFITTVEGTQLIDCCLGYGPLILGHAHPVIKAAITSQLENGWLFGTPTELEIDLAKRVTADHPSIDMLRFVSTGAEATMAAIRLARGFTGKSDIVKVEGGFHGAHDAVLIAAGSGATTHGTPDSAGVLPDFAAHTRQVAFNDPEGLEELLSKNDNIAAFIIEPVMGNIGPILPDDGYLAAVREITAAHDVLLIFDEVITGYRLGIGGAQVKYGIKPDLTTLGKITGGGLPIGLFGGRREIMEMISPAGPVYNAGTFNGNPLTMAAGIAMNKYLHQHPEIYPKFDERTRIIEESIPSSSPGTFVRLGSMFKYFCRPEAPRNYTEAKECDTVLYRKLWEKALSGGLFMPPSQFETNFLSSAHGDGEMVKLSEVYAQ
ncbi:Glutamate-1-semialdehyde 2,1-aminomutase [Methanocorpusculaceae archaeon Sp1]|uniref:Glutamate-1-semialdehyde 2,1-aminomutase n=1 Tax=Methanorbis furvi TaxID=3028299 RepID=A0AAE4ME74_9EURY|nr:Glutamate-1-semialdehyde 2,1-aminomutase [Methanocorpusculaceae archaeon Sp1]MDV0442425.1 Glutamate-1-semialdehyde 2,1-aminomutase [Methanocorpusculaceae archaeon Ag1]